MIDYDWAYFDYAASTPVDPEILDNYLIYQQKYWANANSDHWLGKQSADQIAVARNKIAQLFNTQSIEWIFTSGATEANNLALKGFFAHPNCKNHQLITFNIEHKSILSVASFLQKSGVKVRVLPVLPSGLIDLDLFKKELTDFSGLVSVGWVNNETGVIQPIDKIGKLVKQSGAKLHIDIAQAVGKIAVNEAFVYGDLVSLSGHKIYTPKGIGGLFVKNFPKARIAALLHGGGQENGYRSGTLPTALILAFADGLEKAVNQQQNRLINVEQSFYKITDYLAKSFVINTPVSNSTKYIINVDLNQDFAAILALANQYKIAVSAGSACQSDKSGSYVLKAMQKNSQNSIRISLSHLTNDADIQRLIDFLTII